MPATNNSKKDYSSFDKLSNEELEAILYKDSLSAENNDSDVDAILYISSLLVDREQKNPSGKFTNIDAAWKSFNENYRPYADGTSLYDLDDNCEANNSDSDLTNYSNIVKHTKHWTNLLKIGLAVAAIIVIFLTSSLIAYANGYDIWNTIASWTKETFGFKSELTPGNSNSINIESYKIPDQFKEMANAMSEHGIDRGCLPSYIPEDFSFVNYIYAEASAKTTYLTILTSNDSDEIQIAYSIYDGNSSDTTLGSWEYQKLENNPIIHESNGITFYIMNNNDKYFCSWSYDNLEGYISGISSEDVLIEIISSIKGA